MKFNKLVPELSVKNFEKSLKFYTEVIGFKVEYNRLDSLFAFLSFQGSQIMIEQENENWKVGKLEYPLGRGINLQIEVESIEPIFKALKKNNYPIFVEPKESSYLVGKKKIRCKELLVQDPDGYLLRFSEDLKEEII